MSTNLFDILGQQPLRGRGFGPDDGKPNAQWVVILGHTLWKNRYLSDRDILGEAIRINGEPAVIVGVMPPGIKFPTNAELWTQVIPDADSEKRDRRAFMAVGPVRAA